MRLHLARADARFDPHGKLVLLAQQDRSRWDRAMIAEAVATLERSQARAARPLPAAGGDRGLPYRGRKPGGDRLAPDPGPVRSALGPNSLPAGTQRAAMRFPVATARWLRLAVRGDVAVSRRSAVGSVVG
jgi:hypothetical protein